MSGTGSATSTARSGVTAAAKAVLANPVVASILIGTVWGLAALPLPAFVDQTLALISEAAVPLSLIALGMGLSEYGIREGWRVSAAITVLKLAVQPVIVWLLAWMLSLNERLGYRLLYTELVLRGPAATGA